MITRIVSAALLTLIAVHARDVAAQSTSTSSGQAYPAKPVRLIVPAAPGGNLDVVGRALAQALSEGFGQRVLVENRPGGNSSIGAQYVARSTPDGYTLLMMASTFTNAPSLMRNIPYDAVRDFTGVSLVASIPQVLVVHPSLPVRNVRDLIALAKSQSGRLNYASSSLGSSSFMAMELFKRQAGVNLVRIGYNGDAPALVDLVGGHVPIKFDNFSTAIPLIKSGRLRPLGVTTPGRSALLPGVPPVSDTLPGYEASIYNGVLAPAATPRDVVARLHGEIVRFVQIPEMRGLFAQQGVELQASPTPEHFTAFIKSEVARAAQIIKDAGIKPE